MAQQEPRTERFITILTALRRGMPIEQWDTLEAEIAFYARVSSCGPGWSVAPRYPITFEDKEYDLEHPLLVRQDDSGRMSIVDYHDVVRVNGDGADNGREVPHG